MQLSIVMMVKNEEKYLEECLNSLALIRESIPSELIIVDTGSDDDTVNIAKRYTDKVYFHSWNNDFAAMRNITIRYAKGEWVFVLDGDEILENSSEIIGFFKKRRYKEYNAGIIQVKNYVKGKERYNIVSLSRLFKNHRTLQYKGSIHEQVEIKQPVCFLKTILLHYGYLTTDKELMDRKFDRNSAILLKELKKDPENIFYWCHLAQAYNMHGDNTEALEAQLKAYNIAMKNKVDLYNHMHLYTNLATFYHQNKKYEELEKVCKEALSVRDGYIDLYYYLGKSQQMLYKDEEAIKNYRNYLEMALRYHDYAGYTDITVVTVTLDVYEYVMGELCILYARQEQYEKVLEYGTKINQQDAIKYALPAILHSFIKLQEFDRLENYYFNTIKNANSDLQDTFINILETLESLRKKYCWDKIADIFSKTDGAYGLLNELRLRIYRNELKQFDEKIRTLDFCDLPAYYADIIYYLVKGKYPLHEYLYKVNQNKLEQFFCYLINKYKQKMNQDIIDYLHSTATGKTLAENRMIKCIGKTMLLWGLLDHDEEAYIFERYVQHGISYICQTYHQDIIENQLVYLVKNEEDAFLLYLHQSEKIRRQDPRDYIQYLKKALTIYPAMKNGIDVLIREFQAESSSKEGEIDQYILKIKQAIITHIESRQLEQAKTMIMSYEEIIPNDLEILMLKSNIAVLEY
ncbi:glycosyltransferase involved in cell wall biosynthesis [Anaerosolibacter carboniphilus]|uniref:Glycosyltransferase involved in cell wall biosynthesis n=1 Tax=Anaerosolibacter carboniphilus TaxID=1417629 RepID=A0A841KW01_9FIRM|nr:glycosyltransferase family 2 protein [Anaerosolibacter carboniphilus]MBB6216418.1 glycosyltransferase involved in cell wall biosynthesis [Anaerosolibacter carboniphilus]